MATRKSSRVHPKYKTKCRVQKWPEYDRALTKRGDVTVWFDEDAIEAWTPPHRPAGAVPSAGTRTSRS